jgi:hypothetical protein
MQKINPFFPDNPNPFIDSIPGGEKALKRHPPHLPGLIATGLPQPFQKTRTPVISLILRPISLKYKLIPSKKRISLKKRT